MCYNAIGKEFTWIDREVLNTMIFDKGKQSLALFGSLVKQKFPTICFFLFLFYSILFLFGTPYIMIGMIATIHFQLNYKKNRTLKELFVFIITQVALVVFAFCATRNLFLCIILNIFVPCFFIFLKSSQFTPLGYLAYLMTFTFLQLTPVSISGFITQLLAMMYSLSLFIIVIVVSNHKYGNLSDSFQPKRQGTWLFTYFVTQLLDDPNTTIDLAPLQQIQHSLYEKAYETRNYHRIVSREGQEHYLFALLFQRFIYFLSFLQRNHSMIVATNREFLQNTVAYMEQLNLNNWKYDEDLYQQGKSLYEQAKKGGSNCFFQLEMILRTTLLILEENSLKEKKHSSMKVPFLLRLKEYITHQLHPNSFEFRFSLRMSAILVIGMSYNLLTKNTRSYWLVLNMFLLLRPMYEESNTRMKNRFIGTTIGCIITCILFPFIPNGHFLIFIGSFLATLTFLPIPGTIIHTIFTTSFAIIMSSMAINGVLAAELRLLYTCIAIVIVLIINRFFFPTSSSQQFQYNIQYLFRIQKTYLELLEESMFHPIEYWKIGNGQMQYQLVYGQVKNFLKQSSTNTMFYSKETYEAMFHILWDMFVEMEQMLYAIHENADIQLPPAILSSYIDDWRETLEQIYHTILSHKPVPDNSCTIPQHDLPSNCLFHQWLKSYNENLKSLKHLVYVTYRKFR